MNSRVNLINYKKAYQIINILEKTTNLLNKKLLSVYNIPKTVIFLYSGSFAIGAIFENHCVKSVRVRSYPGPYFPAFGLNKDQNNSEYGHFFAQ